MVPYSHALVLTPTRHGCPPHFLGDWGHFLVSWLIHLIYCCK